MGKLLLAGNFQLKATIPLFKIKKQQSVRDAKKQKDDKKTGGKMVKDDSVSQISSTSVNTKPVAEIDIELNLQ